MSVSGLRRAPVLPVLLLLVSGARAQTPPAPLDLRVMPEEGEQVTVHGVRRFRIAPLPGGAGVIAAPGERLGADAVRDTMTGANLSAFGDAYAFAGTMGNDERSSETGGKFLAPRHS